MGPNLCKSAVMLLVLILVIPRIVTFLPVKGEYKTIVVPNDYPTLSLAIQNARDGDTVFVKRGTYHEEAININKSISLIGESVNETILSLNPPLVEVWYFHNLLWVPDTAIRINADDVKLQGFTINPPNDNYGLGSGIHAVGDAISSNNIVPNRSVYLRGCMLNITCNLMLAALEVVGSKTTVVNNTIKYTLKVQGTFNVISSNKIDRSSYFSRISLNGSFNWVFDNSFSSIEIDDSNSNFIINNSFTGLVMREFSKGCCSDNIISGNRVIGNLKYNDGIKIYEGENNTINANSIRNCENGLTLGTTYETAVANSIYLNNFVNNSWHIKSLSGSDHTVNHFDNGVKGNYYDDYQGNDANRDGIGDSPYTIQETRWEEELKRDVTVVFFQDNYPLMSAFDIDGFSVELPAWVSSLLNSFPEPETSAALPTGVILYASAAAATTVIAVAALALKKRKKS